MVAPLFPVERSLGQLYGVDCVAELNVVVARYVVHRLFLLDPFPHYAYSMMRTGDEMREDRGFEV